MPVAVIDLPPISLQITDAFREPLTKRSITNPIDGHITSNEGFKISVSLSESEGPVSLAEYRSGGETGVAGGILSIVIERAGDAHEVELSTSVMV